MATSNITSVGVAPQLTGQATETATRPTKEQSAPKTAPSLPAPEKPSDEELQIVSQADLSELVDEMQAAIDRASQEPLNVDLRPSDSPGGFVIEIRTGNGDLVQQFPPEKVLNMRSKLDELSGMVIDEMT